MTLSFEPAFLGIWLIFFTSLQLLYFVSFADFLRVLSYFMTRLHLFFPRNSIIVRWKSVDHRITESQNSRGWKGPLWAIYSTPLPKEGHLQQAAQDLFQVGLEYLQRRRLHHLPGQPVPVLHHPQSEEVMLHYTDSLHFGKKDTKEPSSSGLFKTTQVLLYFPITKSSHKAPPLVIILAILIHSQYFFKYNHFRSLAHYFCNLFQHFTWKIGLQHTRFMNIFGNNYYLRHNIIDFFKHVSLRSGN